MANDKLCGCEMAIVQHLDHTQETILHSLDCRYPALDKLVQQLVYALSTADRKEWSAGWASIYEQRVSEAIAAAAALGYTAPSGGTE